MSDANTIGFGQLQQKVIGLEDGYKDLRSEINVLDKKMDSGFNKISEKLDQKTLPQWPAYAILVTVLLAVGGALYYPVRETMSKHETRIEDLRSVSADEVRRLREEHHKTARDLSYLQGQLHPLPK